MPWELYHTLEKRRSFFLIEVVNAQEHAPQSHENHYSRYL